MILKQLGGEVLSAKGEVEESPKPGLFTLGT